MAQVVYYLKLNNKGLVTVDVLSRVWLPENEDLPYFSTRVEAVEHVNATYPVSVIDPELLPTT